MICPRWVAVEAQPDRRRGRHRLPGRGARSAGRRRADLRDRGPGPRDLRRPDARVRASAGLKRFLIPVPLRTSALEPLARPGDAGLRAGRPQARRQPPQSDDHPRSRGARRLPGQAAKRARSNRPSAGQRGRGLRANALVGRRVLGRADGTLRRRSGRHPPDRQPHRVRAGAGGNGLCADPAHRRRRWLVLRQSALVRARGTGPLSEGWACAAGAAPTNFIRATRSTSGESSSSNPIAC